MAKTITATKPNSFKRHDLTDKAAFEEIIRIATAHTDDDGSPGSEPGTFSRGDIGCRIKALPTRLRAKASQHAVRANPANRPAMENIVLPPGVDRPAFLTMAASKYWGFDPRQFTVSFMESAPGDLRARIVEHLNAWAVRINKSFVETSGTGEIRISLGPGGYFSFLGTDNELIPAHQQTMNLEGFSMNTSESEYRRVVRHEAGHALGFEHEHMRSELVQRIDPQKAYTYFWDTQGWGPADVDEQVLTPLEDTEIWGTATADHTSIMCYQLPGEITYDGNPILGGLDINQTDYDFAASLYPQTSSSPAKGGGRKAKAYPEDDWGPANDVRLP